MKNILKTLGFAVTVAALCIFLAAFGSFASGQKGGLGGGPSFLAAVFHDWTLTGSGTAEAPLGINAAAPTEAGQVLTHTGDNALAWQTPPGGGAGPLRIVDSSTPPKEVGLYNYNARALRFHEASNTWLSLPAVPDGFFSTFTPRFVYTGPDCSGTEYMEGPVHNPLFFHVDPTLSGDALYYSTQPVEDVTMASMRLGAGGTCTNISPSPFGIEPVWSVGTLHSIPISEFGLTPPFKLMR
jgi:hypothetical protein